MAPITSDWPDILAGDATFLQVPSFPAQGRAQESLIQQKPPPQDLPRSLISFDGRNLYAAVANELRVCNLYDLKDASTRRGTEPMNLETGEFDKNGGSSGEHHHYTILRLPFVPFALVANHRDPCKTGALAIIGRERIQVHRGGTSINVGTDDDLRRIVKAEWHPSSVGMNHLVVLTADGVLRVYDVSSKATCSTAESAHCAYPRLSGVILPRMLGSGPTLPETARPLDESECTAVSFTFSPPSLEDPMSRYSVHVIFKNSDIFTLCPVTPGKGYADPTLVDFCKRMIDGKEGFDPLFDQTEFATSWGRYVLGNKSSPMEEETQVFEAHFPIGRAFYTKPQGPHIVSRTPKKRVLATPTDIYAFDMCALNLFLIAFQDGNIQIVARLSDLVPNWWTAAQATNYGALFHEQDFDARYFPESILLETIRLDLSRRGNVRLYGDGAGGVLAAHPCGTLQLSFDEFRKHLSDLWEDGYVREKRLIGSRQVPLDHGWHRLASFKGKIAEVAHLVDTQPLRRANGIGDAVHGLVEITDPYLDHVLLILLESQTLVPIRRWQRSIVPVPAELREKRVQELEELRKLRASEADSSTMPKSISLPQWRRPRIGPLEDLPIARLQLSRETGKCGDTMTDTERRTQAFTFVNLVFDILGKLELRKMRLSSVYASMSERVDAHRLEYARQQEELTEVDERLSRFQAKASEWDQDVKGVLEAGRDMLSRMDRLVKRMSEQDALRQPQDNHLKAQLMGLDEKFIERRRLLRWARTTLKDDGGRVKELVKEQKDAIKSILRVKHSLSSVGNARI